MMHVLKAYAWGHGLMGICPDMYVWAKHVDGDEDDDDDDDDEDYNFDDDGVFWVRVCGVRGYGFGVRG